VKEIFDLSAQAEAFVTAYLKQWFSDKIGFRAILLPKPDLVLVLGSQRILSDPSVMEYRAPIIFS